MNPIFQIDRPVNQRRRQQVPTRISRTIEQWLAWIGMALSTVAMGGFTLVMNKVDAATFEEVIMPTLVGTNTQMPLDEAFEAGHTLGAWFGVTLVIVLLLSAAALWRTRARPERRSGAWWYLAAGLACLLGSQLILYPIAFFYFVGAGLFALRPVPEGSH